MKFVRTKNMHISETVSSEEWTSVHLSKYSLGIGPYSGGEQRNDG